ncbi:MAG: hypothetical protein HQ591_09310 [candidate division Zixibacteria bacterium]|nr:hypothetical protein [Candidatus Tariuqbacter arcticus]
MGENKKRNKNRKLKKHTFRISGKNLTSGEGRWTAKFQAQLLGWKRPRTFVAVCILTGYLEDDLFGKALPASMKLDKYKPYD